MDKIVNAPSVSVIMPAYNAELYIREAIDSVIGQSYSNWELIIIDDGSTDTTSKIVEKCLVKDERIQYYYQENGKQGKARNLGISKSKGEYLAFLDADDLWLPEKLEIQLRQIIEKNVDLVFSNSYFFDNYNIHDTSKKLIVQDNIFYDIGHLKLFLEKNRIPILTVLVKREKVLEVGGFAEAINIQNVEDYHLWLKLLICNGVFYSSGSVLAKYRVHNNSVTSRDKLAGSKIPNAFYDLIQLYPNYKKKISQELKLKFKNIYKNNLFTKAELEIWIKKNCYYMSKPQMSYLYLFLNFLLPTKLTKRALIYILNA